MTAPRRERLDVTLRNLAARNPMKVVIGVLLLITLGLVVAVPDVPREHVTDTAVVPEDAGIAEPAFEVLAKVEKKPVTTKKARLLKEQMRKKLEREATKGRETAPKGGNNIAMGSGGADVALAGDAQLRRSLGRHLRGNVRVVEEGAGAARWLASLSMTTGEAKGGGVYAKCSAAMSELPARKLVGSMSNRADVSGDGMNDDELKTAAKDSCAQSLADDVAKWLRARR